MELNLQSDQKGTFSPSLFTYRENDELQVELQAGHEQEEFGFVLRPNRQGKRADRKLSPLLISLKPSFQIHPEEATHKQETYYMRKFKPKKKLNQLVLFLHKQRFVNRLLQNLRRTSKVQATHLQLIQDKASDQQNFITEGKKKNKQQSSLISMMIQNSPAIPKKSSLYRIKLSTIQLMQSGAKLLECILQFIPLVNPDSNKKLIWDSLAALLRFIYFIIIPIDIAFNTWLVGYLSILTFLMISTIVLDLVLRVSTICFDQGSLVTDRLQIFQTQMQKTFFKDFLAVMVLLSALFDKSKLVGYMTIGFFVQYDYFHKTIDYFEDRFLLSKMSQSLWTLIKLMVGLLYIIHIFCCLWFLVSSNTEAPNWINTKELQLSSCALQYLESFYFATVTVLTIGYGDNVPISTNIFRSDPQEKLMAIFFMIAACVWLSYSVNVIGSIINDIKRNQDEITLKLRLINKYMHRKNIAFTLRYRIKQYLTFLWNNQAEGEQARQNEIINDLAPDLKAALHMEAKSAIINQNQFFLKNFSNEFRQTLVQKVKSQFYYPNSTFDTFLNTHDFNYCYVDLGSLSIVPVEEQYQENNCFPKLHEGQFIGLYEFITGQQKCSKYVYRCQGFVQILYITQHDFLQTLREFPIDEEKFHHIKNKMIYQDTKDQLGTECQPCQTAEHDFRECPILSLKQDREVILKRYLFEHAQIRKNHERKFHRRLGSLAHLYEIQSFADIFIEEHSLAINAQQKLQFIDDDQHININQTQQIKPKIVSDEKLNNLFPYQPSLTHITIHQSPQPLEVQSSTNEQLRESLQADHKRQALITNSSNNKDKNTINKHFPNSLSASTNIKLEENDYHNYLQRLKIFNQNQVENLYQLNNQLTAQGQDCETLELIVKKIKNLQKNNISEILPINLKRQTNFSQDLKINEVDLKKYMFYPSQYIMRYTRKNDGRIDQKQSTIISPRAETGSSARKRKSLKMSLGFTSATRHLIKRNSGIE